MKNKAFTLIELLVVVLIIGILATIAVPKYQVAVVKSKLTKAKQTVSDIKKATEMYYLQNNTLPQRFSDLDFAHRFDEDNDWTEDGYTCYMPNQYWEIYCHIDNMKMMYLTTFGIAAPRSECRAFSKDTSDAYHRACQQDTGKTASQADCSPGYCRYYY